MYIATWKKPIFKDYILYNSTYMTYWKRQNYEDRKKISVFQVFGGTEGWIGKAQGIFRAVKLFFMVLYCWIHVIMHLSKSTETECTLPGVNSNVRYGLWLIMMCWRRFISCNKCNTLVGDVDNGHGYAYMWAGVHWKSLYLPLNFAVNLKLL